MTDDDRDTLYRKVVAERFGPAPRLPRAHSGAASRGAGIPDQQTTGLYMQRLSGYGWTPAQISDLTGVPVAEVRQTLARLAAAQPDTDTPEGGEAA